MKKIIILASERSGTNLLRTLLGNHNELSAPVAPHIFDAFDQFVVAYGDLSKKENRIKLIDHTLKLVNHPYVNWNLAINAAQLSEDSSINSIQAVFDSVYAAKCLSENKKHYVCKDNNMHNHILKTELLNKNDDVKYIYLYRDPRDHTSSWLKTPLFMHSAYEISQKWNHEQTIIRKIKNSLNIDLIPVKYEALIQNTAQVMSRVLEELGLPQDESCYQTDRNNKEASRNPLWKNLSKPVVTNNFGKYKKTLTDRDLLLIESVCKVNMQILGYELDTKADWVWKAKRGFTLKEKYIRYKSKKKHREFIDEKMKDLSDKLKLIDSFKKEILS